MVEARYAALGCSSLSIRLARSVSTMVAVVIVLKTWGATGADPVNGMRLWALIAGILASSIPLGTRPLTTVPRLGGILLLLEDMLVVGFAVAAGAAAVAWIAPVAPQLWIVLAVLICACMLVVLSRSIIGRVSARMTRPGTYLVYGHNELGVAVADFLAVQPKGPQVVGFIHENRRAFDNESSPPPDDIKRPTYVDLAAVTSARVERSVAGVIIALPHSTADEIAALRTSLGRSFRRVYLAPPAVVLMSAWPVRADPVIPGCFLLGAPEFTSSMRFAKRAIDIVVASIALVLFAPVLVMCAVLIKLESPGPFMFRQRRFTTERRLFECYKFRTMHVAPAHQEIELTARGDARVTRVGRFLRRTSLDELPQFINVLQGHMSVVGPRPHPPGVKAGNRTYEEVIPDFDDRYKVKPGLTGFAQVNGLRGNTFTEHDVQERFKHDIDYISNWSLQLEFWIIARTLINGFWGKNAF